MVEDLFITGPILYHDQGFDIYYAVVGNFPVPPNKIDGNIARGNEKVGSGLADPTGALGPKNPHIGFLNQIIQIGDGGETITEVTSEIDLMWLHFLGKPMSLVLARRKHKK